MKSENLNVNSFTGHHSNGYSSQNVSEVWFWTGALDYIPEGIGKLFPNLLKFWVGYTDRNLGLKLLRRRNFKNMMHLIYLDVKHNNVAKMEENTLWDLPKLESIVLTHNKLKTISQQQFSRNTVLKFVEMSSNYIESLSQDLFKRNPRLKRVSFANNRLKSIYPDFTGLKSLKHLNLLDNICINSNVQEGKTVEDLQEIIRENCTAAAIETNV